MKKLIIMLDFISDPLRKDVFDTKNKELVTGIDLVDNDEYVQKNYNNQPVFFDKNQEKKDKYKMLDLLGKLMKRLDELNHVSFEIDYRENERVKTYKFFPVLGLGRD